MRLKQGVTPDGQEIATDNSDGVVLNAFLQNDWHVRVMGSDGLVRNASLLSPGDEILAFVDQPGRHTGLRVTEHIVER